MTSIHGNQLKLNFEPSLPERYPSLREYVAFRTAIHPRPAKSIAADMDMSPSVLSRKLNPSEGDTQRMNLDDFEGWLQSTGDAAAVVQYLAAKYLDSDDTRKARAINTAEQLLAQLAQILPTLQETQKRSVIKCPVANCASALAAKRPRCEKKSGD